MNRIAFYCPDTHLTYDLRALDERGVGGGVTSRIRLAHALANRGHRVTAYVNCPEESVIEGVEYRHFTRLNQLETDIFIASTSGGAYDLSPLRGARNQTKLRILMAHGAHPPRGLDCMPFDLVCAPSNFIRNVVVERWGIPAERIFVCPRGVVGEFFAQPPLPERNPCALAYAAHPSKGLNEAIAVLRLLRAEDLRFTLHVYGGSALWGEEQQPLAPEPGVFDHGLIGQRQLAREWLARGFSMNLESLEESFGLAVAESMRAGCIVLASPVGAYPEIIRDGENGFLIEGAHSDPSTHRRAADLILELTRRPAAADAIRRRAIAAPLDWDEVAQRWEAHWRSAM